MNSNIFEIIPNSHEWEEWRSKLLTASEAGEWLLAEPKCRMTVAEIKTALDLSGTDYKKSSPRAELLAKLHPSVVAGNRDYTQSEKDARSKAMCRMLGSELSPITRLATQSDFPGNKFTDFGHGFEEEAAQTFAMENGLQVRGGYCAEVLSAGCSPDRLVSMEGDWNPFATLEIKCRPKQHVESVLAGILPYGDRMQVHFQMAVTGFQLAYYYAYSPDMKGLCLRIERDALTTKIVNAIKEFSEQYAAFKLENEPKLKP